MEARKECNYEIDKRCRKPQPPSKNKNIDLTDTTKYKTFFEFFGRPESALAGNKNNMFGEDSGITTFISLHSKNV